jgi:predicted dehydrogenase
METIRYGLIGTGYFGSELAKIMVEQEGAAVTVVCVHENSGGLEKELNCAVEYGAEALCARTDVDAVIIASPNWLHREHALTAIRYGKHVFCEKPAALSYPDCKEMIEAAKNRSLRFMVGHIMYFYKGIQTAKRMIQEGHIGDLLYCHSARNIWEAPQASTAWKKTRDLSGGRLYHYIHELECIESFMGLPLSVTVTGGRAPCHHEESGDDDDWLFLLLEFPGGRQAVLEYGSVFRWSENYLLIEGTRGAIRIDMHDMGGTMKTATGEERFTVYESPQDDEERRCEIYEAEKQGGALKRGKPGERVSRWFRSSMVKEMACFNAVLHGKKVADEFRPLLDGSSALASIVTADAAMLSLKENRKVNLSEIT